MGMPLSFSHLVVLIGVPVTSFVLGYYYAPNEVLQQQTPATEWVVGALRANFDQIDPNRLFMPTDDGVTESWQQIPAETNSVSNPIAVDSLKEFQEMEQPDQQLQRQVLADYLRANGFSEEDIEVMTGGLFDPPPEPQPPAPGEPLSPEQALSNLRDDLAAHGYSSEEIEAML